MDTDYKKAANITVVALGIALVAWIFFEHVLNTVMPFLLAALISALVSPLAKKISKRIGIPPKICAAFLLVVVFLLVGSLFYFAISRLILEVGNLLGRLAEDPETIGNAVEGAINKLTGSGSHFSFLQKVFESESIKNLGIDINQILRDALGSMLSSLTGALPMAAVSLVKKVPNALLFIIVFMIASFYFSADGGDIFDKLLGVLPKGWREKLPALKEKFKKTLVGYIKAYFLIMLLTFVEMLLGLTLLGVEYALLMAIVISVVDVLPILGTGAVLVPWAIFAFMASNTPLGVGLLVLYAVSLIIRQFAEPKIVGSTLGIHPLASLAAVYLGLKFLGFIGIFVGPMIAMLIREVLFREGKEENNLKEDISEK